MILNKKIKQEQVCSKFLKEAIEDHKTKMNSINIFKVSITQIKTKIKYKYKQMKTINLQKEIHFP